VAVTAPIYTKLTILQSVFFNTFPSPDFIEIG